MIATQSDIYPGSSWYIIYDWNPAGQLTSQPLTKLQAQMREWLDELDKMTADERRAEEDYARQVTFWNWIWERFAPVAAPHRPAPPQAFRSRPAARVLQLRPRVSWRQKRRDRLSHARPSHRHAR